MASVGIRDMRLLSSDHQTYNGPLSSACSGKGLSVDVGTRSGSVPNIHSFVNGISPESSIAYARPKDGQSEATWLALCRSKLEVSGDHAGVSVGHGNIRGSRERVGSYW